MHDSWMTITPELPVPDVREAQRYYRDILGFKIGWAAEDESYGAVYAGTNELFLRRAEAPFPSVVCCVRVRDVQAVFDAYAEAGAEILRPLEEKPWQMREFSVRDPHGHVFRIGQSTLMR